MFHRPVVSAMFVLILLLADIAAVTATEAGASFEDEIRLSCEKYALEDQVPPKEVKEYVDLCVRDFNKPQPLDTFSPLKGEEGIENIPLIDDPDH